VGDGLVGVGHELLDGVERHLRLNLLQHLLSPPTHHHHNIINIIVVVVVINNNNRRERERKKADLIARLEPVEHPLLHLGELDRIDLRRRRRQTFD
jgi:hypothetical protein